MSLSHQGFLQGNYSKCRNDEFQLLIDSKIDFCLKSKLNELSCARYMSNNYDIDDVTSLIFEPN